MTSMVSNNSSPFEAQDRPIKRRRTSNGVTDSFSLLSLDIASAACHRCHSRKCDAELPKCGPCRKADVGCEVHDPTAPRAYTRREFQELFEKAQRLERELGVAPDPPRMQNDEDKPAADRRQRLLPEHASGSYEDKAVRIRDQAASERPARRSQAPTENRFVGQEHTAFGLFLSRLDRFRVPGSTTQQSAQPEVRATRMPYHAPHAFPARDIALRALHKYFQHFHPAQPVLSAEEIYGALDKYLDVGSEQALEAVELFRLLMGVALGSIYLFREEALELHPFGYFTAALEAWTPASSSFNGIEDIEHLLLISHFGLFYDIGCSVWELGRFGMRIAVELGLYRLTPVKEVCASPPMVQRSRRVFWMVYMLDRSSSRTLGRPFAIDDASIEAPLPNVDDSSGAYHNWRIGLSRITSEIRCHLKRPSNAPAGGLPQSLRAASAEFVSTLALLRQFNSKLGDWMDWIPAPSLQNDVASMFQATKYLDLLHQEARLGLLRAAIDKLGTSPLPPPKSLLRQSLATACGVISGFQELKTNTTWVCNRAEAHTLFTTSLVALSLMQASDAIAKESGSDNQEPFGAIDEAEDPWREFLDDQGWKLDKERASSTISIAGQLLVWVSDALPDFAVCARIFDDTKRSLGIHTANPRPELLAPALPTIARGAETSADGDMEAHVHTSNDTGLGRDSTATLHCADSATFFDLGTTLSTQGVDVPPFFGPHGLSWPLSNLEGIAALDACFSGYVWDTNMPWDGSPSTTMDSV